MSAESFCGVEPVVFRDLVEVRNGGDHGEIGECEGFGEFVLEHGAARGVRARLEQDPQPRIRIALAQALHRKADRRRDGGRNRR